MSLISSEDEKILGKIKTEVYFSDDLVLHRYYNSNFSIWVRNGIVESVLIDDAFQSELSKILKG